MKEIVDFMEKEFMTDLGYSYQQFWSKFLNEASNKRHIEEAHKWLDHVIFFNSFILRLKNIYRRMSPEIFDSIFGEIMLSNIIGDLCLLIESFCKTKCGITGTFSDIYDKHFPGRDSKRLRMVLEQDFDIGWAKNAEVSNSDDGKNIHLSKDKNSAEIMIDEKKEKAILKISDGRTYNLKVKKKNGNLNIYLNNTIKSIYSWTGGFLKSSNFQGDQLNATLNQIFNNNYNNSNDPLENSFYLTWGLRNNFHHNIESMAIMGDNKKATGIFL